MAAVGDFDNGPGGDFAVEIRVLLDGTLDAGDHAVTWGGRDDSGRALQTGGKAVTTGLSLLR